MVLFFSWAGAATVMIWIWTVLLLITNHAGAELPRSPTHQWDGCYPSDGNYTANSFYYTSLKAVLSKLASKASAGSMSYTTSSGAAPNQVYGMYYCRGDVSSSFCSDCIEAATKVASQGGPCFPITQGVVWYYECTLQYSNESKIGMEEEGPLSWAKGLSNVSSPSTFGPLLVANMKTLISTAAYGNKINGSSSSSSLPAGFATGKVDVSVLETVYTLVQCRPDINGSSCDACLKSAYSYITTCCASYSSKFTYIFYPSCVLMYNLQPFYFPPAPLLLPPPATPPPSPHASSSSSSGSNNITRVAVPIAAMLLFLVLGGDLLIYCRSKKNNEPAANPSEVVTKLVPSEEQRPDNGNNGNGKDIGNVEFFNFKTIEFATANFSDANKLGEGGFGSVCKGILPNEQVIAVKRLTRSSDHHIREFTNEVAVVAKLQHRNLVRLLGFSTFQEERILAYEFLPKLSLDKILFDTTKSINMDWTTRLKIIEGIAWGLRYLHIDSLLTIVHRDLKTSNILLDKDMSPKIADFGLAKLVTLNETVVNVTTVAGTMGYMAPEYIMVERCTIKSDIYSFGVIILEIISGKNIAKFYDPITNDGLLHYVWRLWNEKEIEKLIDPTLQNQYSRIESERCVQIGLLCVQDDEVTRPTIRVLMSMLDNQSLKLSYPAPSTFHHNKTPTTKVSQEGEIELTQTDLYQVSSTDLLQVPHPR